MKTNCVGQTLRSDTVSLPSDNYNGEFFTSPDKAIEGEVGFEGNAKIYKMGYIQGYPHMFVESYSGKGVVVRYIITGETFSWNWVDRNKAWDWANARKEHLKMLR